MEESLAYIKKKAPEAESVLNRLVSTLSTVNDSEEMNDLITFLAITLLQVAIVSLGDIYLLGVTVTNPGVFVPLSLLISLVFTHWYLYLEI